MVETETKRYLQFASVVLLPTILICQALVQRAPKMERKSYIIVSSIEINFGLQIYKIYVDNLAQCFYQFLGKEKLYQMTHQITLPRTKKAEKLFIVLILHLINNIAAKLKA